MTRVLIVEEHEGQARLLAIGLCVQGFDAEPVSSAGDALDRLAAAPFDAAMVDLMLPGTNGIELARVLRERHPATRVVLTSVYHLSERQLARADCGAIGFVPKPLDLGDLAAFLRDKVSPRSPEVSGAFARGIGAPPIRVASR